MNRDIIISKCVRVQENPFIDSSQMDHWKIILFNKKTKHQMTLIFSKGYLHKGAEPTIEEILKVLDSEIYYAESTYEEFLDNMGFNDSIFSRKRYKAICRQTEKYNKILEE